MEPKPTPKKGKAPKEKPQTVRFPAPPQHGPLQYVEVSAACVVAGYYEYDKENNRTWKKSNACKSQTHYRLKGVPMCSTHALRTMNDMLIERDFDFSEQVIEQPAEEKGELNASSWKSS